MSLEGVIEGVLETYPLQLTVSVAGGSRQISLRPDTAVTLRAEAVDPGRLNPGQRIRIDADETEGGATAARAIEILAEAPPASASPPPPPPPEGAATTEKGEPDAPEVEYLPSAPVPADPPADDEA